jgi:hypothetical protein
MVSYARDLGSDGVMSFLLQARWHARKTCLSSSAFGLFAVQLFFSFDAMTSPVHKK